MHKLWPHSAKKPHATTSGAHKKRQLSQNGASAAAASNSSSFGAGGGVGKLEKPTSSMSEDGQSIADGSTHSGDPNNVKTHMCLVNELAKYNKVSKELIFEIIKLN